MKLKKKVIFGMVAGLFAVATVFNMSMLNENGVENVSLDGITQMATAQSESTEDPFDCLYCGGDGVSAGSDCQYCDREHDSNTGWSYFTQGATKDELGVEQPCPNQESSDTSANAGYGGATVGGSYSESQSGTDGRTDIRCGFGYTNCTEIDC